jgi:tRNA-uridine 2-sulfurtransferase
MHPLDNSAPTVVEEGAEICAFPLAAARPRADLLPPRIDAARRRILVAMSGGVDSSVTAALLHEQGHEVIGVTLQLYDHGAAIGRKGACCAGEDIHDARRVADRIGIAHYVIDAEQRFRDAVIQPFADAYAAGQTPVPCIACNQTVKFTDLIDLVGDLGADYLATGHYVRRFDGAEGAELHRAVDPTRDQSWFLFATTRAQLDRCLFPLGGFASKDEVRAEAARLGLVVAKKPDSQDICFVPNGSYADVVAKFRPDAMEAGEIVDRQGRVLGRHDGIARYTIGQAKRLGAAQSAETRRVVVGLDPATKRVTVDTAPPDSATIRLRDVNWLTAPRDLDCTVKLRSGETPRPARVFCADAGVLVELDAPARIAAGQACVFYDGERVLGGGFILPN